MLFWKGNAKMNEKQRAILAEVGKKLEEFISTGNEENITTKDVLDRLTPEQRQEFIDTWQSSGDTGDWKKFLPACSNELLHALEHTINILNQERTEKQKRKEGGSNDSIA